MGGWQGGWLFGLFHAEDDKEQGVQRWYYVQGCWD